jgi:hypothetical protein
MRATKAKKSKRKLFTGKITINDNLQDFSKSPFFVKKLKEAEELIKKIGLPPREFKK